MTFDVVRVATVAVASDGNYDNRSRLALMCKVVRKAAGIADVLIFPAGYYTTKGRPSTRLGSFQMEIMTTEAGSRSCAR